MIRKHTRQILMIRKHKTSTSFLYIYVIVTCTLLLGGIATAQNFEVISVSPSQYSGAVPVHSSITIQFSEDVNLSTVNSSSVIIRGELSGSILWTLDYTSKAELTFQPEESFISGETVHVTITTQVENDAETSTLASPFQFTFTVAYNPAPAHFIKQTIKNFAHVSPYATSIVDMDGDGDNDFVALIEELVNGCTIEWFENNGTGNFTSVFITTFAACRDISTADINADGSVDLLVATESGELYWFQNDGTQNFTQHFITDTLSFLFMDLSIKIVDMNGDGHLDILAAADGFNDSLAYQIILYENDGAQEASFTAHVLFEAGAGNQLTLLEPADVDNDGSIDVIIIDVSAALQASVYVLENHGNQNYSSHLIYTASALVFGAIADFNSDGKSDIILSSIFVPEYEGRIYWVENKGWPETEFAIHTLMPGSLPSFVKGIADLNGDESPDLVLQSIEENTGVVSPEIKWYANDGNTLPGLMEPVTIAHANDAADFTLNTHLPFADFTGDGTPDFLMLSSSPYSISLYTNVFPSKVAGRSIFLNENGSKQFIKADVVNSQFSGNVDFTTEFWLKTDKNNQPRDQETLFGIHSNSGGNKLILLMQANGFPHIFLGAFKPSVEIDIGDNEWHHMAIIQDSDAGEIRLYIDGKHAQSISGTVDLNTADLWSFGQEYDGGPIESDFTRMLIDDIRIWKTARSEDEIRQNMHQPADNESGNLAAYWPMDETNGEMLQDASGMGNHAVLINGPLRSNETHPYGVWITGGEGWRMLSSPAGTATYGELLQNVWTQGFVNADTPNYEATVYLWDNTLQEWTPISDASEIPGAGTGFIAYIFDDNDFDGTPDGFPKLIQTKEPQNSGSISPELSYADTGNPDEDGWNLVGNPYGATIEWGADLEWEFQNIDHVVYIWNNEANSYQTWNGSSGTLDNGLIAPFQGFWVKANNENPTLTFSDNARGAGGIFLKAAEKEPVPQIRFMLSQQEAASRAVLMFSSMAELDKDPLDAYKLQPLQAPYLSLYSTLRHGSALDINALPLHLEEPLEIGLDFAGSDLTGDLKLSWLQDELPSGWAAKLLDNQTGTEVNLKEQSEYIFEVEDAYSSKAYKTTEAAPQKATALLKPALLIPEALQAAARKTTNAGAADARFTLTIWPANTTSNEERNGILAAFSLGQNYPNPFNPSTIIRYELPVLSTVTLEVFDVTGRKVITLLEGETKPAGIHEVTLDGRHLASGVYIYRLRAGQQVFTKKLTLIK